MTELAERDFGLSGPPVPPVVGWGKLSVSGGDRG